MWIKTSGSLTFYFTLIEHLKKKQFLKLKITKNIYIEIYRDRLQRYQLKFEYLQSIGEYELERDLIASNTHRMAKQHQAAISRIFRAKIAF